MVTTCAGARRGPGDEADESEVEAGDEPVYRFRAHMTNRSQ